MQAGLSHQRQQAGGFKAHGFAAGVGAGNNQQSRFRGEGQVNGDYCLRIKQGMASRFQVNADCLGGGGGPVVQYRRGGKSSFGVAGFGKNHVYFSQRLHGGGDKFAALIHFAGERGQNTGDFLLFLQLQFLPLVIEVYHHHRFYKQGGPADALIMDDALHPALKIRLEGQNVTPVSLGDKTFLQILVHLL